MKITMMIMIALVLLMTGCASTATTVLAERYTLTSEEQAKLDPQLIRLLTTGELNESDYDISTRADGTPEVGIIIRSDNVEELKKQGVQPGSVFGKVVTARLSVAELKKILSSSGVLSIQNSSKNIIH